MTETQRPRLESDETIERPYREYVLDVCVVEVVRPGDGERRYRFEAPEHEGRTFDDPEMATLYADVYFDVNGFEEAGTGDRGVPPEIIQAGRDTLAAYFLTQQAVDLEWVASFWGKQPGVIERYANTVRHRAEEIRDGVEERGLG